MGAGRGVCVDIVQVHGKQGKGYLISMWNTSQDHFRDDGRKVFIGYMGWGMGISRYMYPEGLEGGG